MHMRKPVINTAEVARAVNIQVAKTLLLLNPRYVHRDIPTAYLRSARSRVAVRARRKVDRCALGASELFALQARQHELSQALSASSRVDILPESVENEV